MADKIENAGLLDFFLERMLDLFHAEKKFMKCFAALSIAAYTDELSTALDAPSTEAEAHMNRLKLILKSLKKKTEKKECEIVTALIRKSRDLIKTNDPGTAMRDAAIVYLAQLVAHYKIASYEVLTALAMELQLDQAELLLGQCLTEEKNTSSYLTQIAQNIINPAAKENVFLNNGA